MSILAQAGARPVLHKEQRQRKRDGHWLGHQGQEKTDQCEQIAAKAGLFGVPAVAVKGQYPEKTAEYILAF